MRFAICMVENLEIESSLLTRPSQREAKIKGLAMGVILEVEGGVMVEETGQQQGRMTASNVAGLDIGPETVHQLGAEVEVVEEVVVHSLLHVLGILGLPPVEIVTQMFAIGTWMTNMIEAVTMTEIVTKSKMIVTGVAIAMLLTGIT